MREEAARRRLDRLNAADAVDAATAASDDAQEVMMCKGSSKNGVCAVKSQLILSRLVQYGVID